MTSYNILTSLPLTQNLLSNAPRITFKPLPKLHNILVHPKLPNPSTNNKHQANDSYPYNKPRSISKIHQPSASFNSRLTQMEYLMKRPYGCSTENLIHQLQWKVGYFQRRNKEKRFEPSLLKGEINIPIKLENPFEEDEQHNQPQESKSILPTFLPIKEECIWNKTVTSYKLTLYQMGQHSLTPVMRYNTNSNTKARALTSTLQLAQLTEQSLPTVCSGLDPRPAGND
uniref:Uncharacterized protein n=1 Tax=Timema douglasi TaxID=61478 RepID=A0A7R8VNQ6_TIMDO|nr:unnamed protein product [Timema douglasi]